MKNKQVLLASRPTGAVEESHFSIVETDIPKAADNEFVVRAHYMSLDPYMRGRMDDAKSYAAKAEVGEVMVGAAVGEVIESRHDKFQVGDFVQTRSGWQQYGVSDGSGVRKLDANYVPLSAYLGAVGMPGVTAWIGLNEHGKPKAGETVVVSAASGAVGSAVGQLAKARGARVVGIAGGADKCSYVVNELGFDACIDYKKYPDLKSLSQALQDACPGGIDGHFENVGSLILEAVMQRANAFCRVAVCGMISGYNGEPIPLTSPQLILVNRMKIEGFIVSEHMEVWPEALKELGAGVVSGKLKYRETVAQGIEAAPEAFIGLLKGKNFGKQLVKLV